MTERDKDERDLAMLRDYEAGLSVNELRLKYRSTAQYINKLIEDAL